MGYGFGTVITCQILILHYLIGQLLFYWVSKFFYIAFQASKGKLSHYNISTPAYAALYSMMAVAATLVTLYTAYVGVLFFQKLIFPNCPIIMFWAMRLGIIIFVIFSFEGFFDGFKIKTIV